MARSRWLRGNGGTAFPKSRAGGWEHVMRVLIVDDEPLARRGVCVRLRKCTDNEIVGECGDGLSAVKKILDLSPDLVFLDVQMPGMDGFEVLRSLPEENLPGVIFLTASQRNPFKA